MSIDSTSRFLEAHGERLAAWRGRTLDATWVAWDLDENAFFADEAVILQIGGQQVQVVCWRLTDIALTWTTIDLDRPPAWVSDWGPEIRLEWRIDALDPLRKARGATLLDVHLIEHRPRVDAEGWWLNGLQLTHTAGILGIFNALDENGITDRSLDSELVRSARV
ncbi:MAG: hypothetical protein AAGE94_11335 [Acidobacteriota bacterium]